MHAHLGCRPGETDNASSSTAPSALEGSLQRLFAVSELGPSSCGSASRWYWISVGLRVGGDWIRAITRTHAHVRPPYTRPCNLHGTHTFMAASSLFTACKHLACMHTWTSTSSPARLTTAPPCITFLSVPPSSPFPNTPGAKKAPPPGPRARSCQQCPLGRF